MANAISTISVVAQARVKPLPIGCLRACYHPVENRQHMPWGVPVMLYRLPLAASHHYIERNPQINGVITREIT